MGYGSRAVDLLAKYYQGEIVSLDENAPKKIEEEGEDEENGEGNVQYES